MKLFGRRDDKEPRQNLIRVLKNNLRILGKVIKTTPDYFVAVLIWGLAWGVINSIEAVFTYQLFNALDTGASFAQLAGIIGTMAAFYVVAYALDVTYWEAYKPILQQKLELRLHAELFEKARSLDVACYDDPAFYNDFVWAMDEAGSRADNVLNDTGKVIDKLLASGALAHDGSGGADHQVQRPFPVPGEILRLSGL